MIAVVIPYFQRQAGILRKSLRSVFAQKDVEAVQIIIVDDSSPAPVEPELEEIGQNHRFPIRVIRQSNAGPGAARNRALDNLPEGTKYVAFIDSDDEWSDMHLVHALSALESGHDFYFANLMHLGATISAMERRTRLDLGDHPVIGSNDRLRSFRGDMFNQIITGNVIGTSTVVFDVGKFGDIRFRPELRSAGEDYLFWMAIAKAGAKFSFSTEVEATYGSGVNVYSGSGWGTEGHPLRIHNEIAYRKLIGQLYPLSQEQKAFLAEKIQQLREHFVIDLLHRVRHRKPLPWKVVRDQFVSDPKTIFAIFPAVMNAVLNKRKDKSDG